MPLFGAFGRVNSDPFYQQRLILGSTRGTIMELGITPLLTSGFVTHLIAAANLVPLTSKVGRDRVEKTLAMGLCIGQAVLYVFSGQYGTIKEVGMGNALLIVGQLTGAGVLVLLWDQVSVSGWEGW